MFRVLKAWYQPIGLLAVMVVTCALGAQALSDGLAGHAFHGPAPSLVKPAAAKRIEELNLSPWFEVAKGERNEYPDVAVDAAARAWVTWQRFEHPDPSDLREEIVLAPFDEQGSIGDTIILEDGPGERFWPRIVADGDRLWVAWNARVNGHWFVHGCVVRGGIPGPIQVLSSGKREALRPVVGLDGFRRPWVAWEEERDGHFAIVLQRFEPNATAMTVTMDGEHNLRPSLAPGPNGGLWIAWDRYVDGGYSVWMRPVSGHRMGEPIAVAGVGDSTEGGWSLAPSLATAPDGTLWIAWHTNVEPHTGRHTISERIRVAAYKDDTLFEPGFGQPPPIQASIGGQYLQVEDTVEFPNLAVDPQGRLWLTARRGQGYFGMVADSEGWHGPYNLARLGWGGRGRELRLAASHTGAIFTVARRMHKVAMQVLTPPHLAPGGPLELKAKEPAQLLMASRSAGASMLGQSISTDIQGPRDGDLRGRPEEQQAFAKRLVQGITPPPPAEEPISQRWFESSLASAPLVPPVATAYLGHSKEPEHLLLGDIHTHSWHSDGTGDPDQIFLRARDLRGLNFVALTDHDISNGNILSPSEFAYIQLMADVFNDPGHFITIKGYEWTSKTVGAGGSGHKNVYFPGNTATFYGYGSGVDDTQTLFGLLRGAQAIAIPHHIGWTGTDWDNHDPEIQPNVEIVSVHGAFEHPHNKPVPPRANLEGMFVRDGLNRGLRFGVVGGSDGHGVAWHYGVSRKEDPWETGLTGVYAREHSRGAVVDALRDRRCYATSGSFIFLHIQGDGVPMGGELTGTAPPVIELRVKGSHDLERVDLIRDGSVLKSFPGGGRSLNASYREPSLSIGEHYYYARVIQRDGEVAWSSPIFVEIASQAFEAARSLPKSTL